MEKITAVSGAVHALEQRLGWYAGENSQGITWCGRTVIGRTGGTIPSGITCGSCLRMMRKAGWLV